VLHARLLFHDVLQEEVAGIGIRTLAVDAAHQRANCDTYC